jgi:outer membrane protein assembly factor BamB
MARTRKDGRLIRLPICSASSPAAHQSWCVHSPCAYRSASYYGAHALGISPDGATVFVTGDGYYTFEYDATTGAQLWMASHNYGSATALGLSPDGAVHVTGYSWSGKSEDYDSVAYDATTGTELWSSSSADGAALNDYAYALAVSPDGAKVFVTGANNGASGKYSTLALDAVTGAQLRMPAIAPGSLNALAVSPNGSALFATGMAGGYPNGDYGTIAYDISS